MRDPTAEQLVKEAKFLNCLNTLASLYGCTVQVDFTTNFVTINGPNDACEDFAAKLGEIFKDNEV